MHCNDDDQQRDLKFRTLKNKQDMLYALVIYFAEAHKLELNVEWVIDSGCTQHTCNNAEAFAEMSF